MIGWSEADITPATDKFISLAGQYYTRFTKEIHSRMKTVAVAFGSAGKQHFLPAEKFGGYGGMVINGQCGSEAGFMLADITVEEINSLFAQSR